MQNTRKIS